MYTSEMTFLALHPWMHLFLFTNSAHKRTGFNIYVEYTRPQLTFLALHPIVPSKQLDDHLLNFFAYFFFRHAGYFHMFRRQKQNKKITLRSFEHRNPVSFMVLWIFPRKTLFGWIFHSQQTHRYDTMQLNMCVKAIL